MSMKTFSFILTPALLMLLLAAGWTSAYKPVILVHGVLSGPRSFKMLTGFIKKAHPGTEVTAIDLFNDGNSTEPMWKQVEGFGKVIQKIMEKSPEGVHLLCFSQALLTVGSAQVPGGPTDINANDPEVQAALKFAMKEYNKGSSDQYLYVVVDVISVQGQVVAGYNYFLSVKIAKTLCRKNSNVSGCSAISNSPMAKTYECTFVVWSRPWLNYMQLVCQQCY